MSLQPKIQTTDSSLASAQFEHTMLGTSDYQGTLAWYQEKLGFTIKREWTVPEFPDLELAYLEKNGFVIEVVASLTTPKPGRPADFHTRLKQPGYGHLAFLVDNVDSVTSELESQGVSIIVPPTDFPDSGRRLSFVEDNSGYLIEFLQELEPAEATEPSDEEQIRALTAYWGTLWSPGRSKFDAEGFRKIFAEGPGAIEVYDNVEGDVLTISSVDEYVNTWKPFMEPLQVWATETEILHLQVAGELAYASIRIKGTDTKNPDGETIPFGQYGTHIWKKLPGQGWRIVHEHLTAFEVSK